MIVWFWNRTFEISVGDDVDLIGHNLRNDLATHSCPVSVIRIRCLILFCFQRYRCYPIKSGKALHSFGV
jgi:hypothetical protein